MAAGIARICEGLTRAGATGSRTFYPVVSGWFAEALALAGEVDEGLAVLDQALGNSAASGQKGADAELRRLRGELLRRTLRPDLAQAEVSFHTALAIAREQGTRGYELRAATSLARLWGEQGRRTEARDLPRFLTGCVHCTRRTGRRGRLRWRARPTVRTTADHRKGMSYCVPTLAFASDPVLSAGAAARSAGGPL
jgi:hypothetical protein